MNPTYAAYGTGTLPIHYSTDPTAVSLTADTPSDDLLYQVSSQAIHATGTTQNISFTGGSKLAPVLGTAGTATGDITVNTAPGFPVAILLSVRSTDSNENVNSTSVIVNTANTPVSYTIDDIAPGTYALDVIYSNGLKTILPGRSIPITVTSGGIVTNSFTIAP